MQYNTMQYNTIQVMACHGITDSIVVVCELPYQCQSLKRQPFPFVHGFYIPFMCLSIKFAFNYCCYAILIALFVITLPLLLLGKQVSAQLFRGTINFSTFSSCFRSLVLCLLRAKRCQNKGSNLPGFQKASKWRLQMFSSMSGKRICKTQSRRGIYIAYYPVCSHIN